MCFGSVVRRGIVVLVVLVLVVVGIEILVMDLRVRWGNKSLVAVVVGEDRRILVGHRVGRRRLVLGQLMRLP